MLSGDEMLTKFSFKYNGDLRVMICTLCHTAVQSMQLAGHACKQGEFKNSLRFKGIMENCFEGMM